MEVSQAHLVEEAFGCWPFFHDAEVIDIGLHRNNPPSVTSSIHVRQYAPANIGTVQYEMALTHDYTISLEFLGVSKVSLDGLNQQNVIDDLSISQEGGSCKVIFESIYGMECSFLCNAISVVGVANNGIA